MTSWFLRCASDSERLWLLDLLAPQAESHSSLFIDDAQFGASSPAAAPRLSKGLDAYARSTGVVFETGLEDKTRFVLDGVGPAVAGECYSSLAHSILGGSPAVVPATVVLGAPWGSEGEFDSRAAIMQSCRSDASRITKAVNSKGAAVLRCACSAAFVTPWPLIARRFYMARADARVTYLAPLAIADPLIGLQLRSLQERWAMAVVLGKPAGRFRLPRLRGRQLLADLGWRPLWITTAAAAIALYMSMKTDMPGYDHTRVANLQPAIPGTWIAAVRSLLARYSIPGFVLPDVGLGDARSQRKKSLKSYRSRVVTPILRKARCHDSFSPPLPWGWIAMNARHAFSTEAFDLWFRLRTFGDFDHERSQVWECRLCGVTPALSSTTLREHLESGCPIFEGIADAYGFRACSAFESPSCPNTYTNILNACTCLSAK